MGALARIGKALYSCNTAVAMHPHARTHAPRTAAAPRRRAPRPACLLMRLAGWLALLLRCCRSS
eukprot:COSAG05_NODE_31_length_28416_cov_170.150652_2_plen_64_part_00